jgi:hypothetical protein
MTNQQTDYKIINSDAILDIPTDVAVCPYCGLKLTAQFTGWFEDTTGYIADEVSLDCESEPDFDDDNYDDWLDGHSEMPYVYWLPACKKVESWVKKNYRFDLSDTSGDLTSWNEGVKDWAK